MNMNFGATPDIVRADIEMLFGGTQVNAAAPAGNFYGAKREGDIGASSTHTSWTPTETVATSSPTAGTARNTVPLAVNGYPQADGTQAGLFDWTCAVAFLGREGINLEQLAPTYVTVPRGGIERLYADLS